MLFGPMIGGGEVVKVSLKTSEAAVKKEKLLFLLFFKTFKCSKGNSLMCHCLYKKLHFTFARTIIRSSDKKTSLDFSFLSSLFVWEREANEKVCSFCKTPNISHKECALNNVIDFCPTFIPPRKNSFHFSFSFFSFSSFTFATSLANVSHFMEH